MTYRDFLLLAPPVAVLCAALGGFLWLLWQVFQAWKGRHTND